MDRVTFEIAPLNERIRGAAVLVAALALQVIAMTLAPWHTARIGDDSLSLRPFTVVDAPELTVVDAPELTSDPSSAWHTLGMIVLVLFGIAYFARLTYMVVTIVYGSPIVKRGLFSSKLTVAWKSSFRAQLFTATLTLLAVYAAIDVPTVSIKETEQMLPATLSYSWGGALLVIACLVAHVGLYLIARHPLLAQSQMWEPPASLRPSMPAPVRASRPMIKSPLPPPPNLAADPFRSPPRGRSLEDKLVRPALQVSTPAVVKTDNADEPSLLT